MADILALWTGGAGALAGLVAGIVRDAPLLMFSLAGGAQCFVLGSSFWGG